MQALRKALLISGRFHRYCNSQPRPTFVRRRPSFLHHFSNMVKLYYAPESCGVASFIAAVAAGVHISVEQADLEFHKTSAGEDFYKINPKGNVPALVLDDGTVLNEGSAVLQWIADQVELNQCYVFPQRL
jgi:hypothetical protein